MDINDLKRMKLESGMTNQDIADMSGIPISTVNKIFSGATKNPRYSTLLAIEQVLATRENIPFTYDDITEQPMLIREPAVPYQYHARTYRSDDIEKLEEVRAELIDGALYMLAAPSRRHQRILTRLLFQIEGHIQKNHGKCQVYPAPFDVRIFGDDSSVVQPDLSVICRPEMLTDRGCTGAPDWLIEIVSESNPAHDYVTKLMKYQKARVREYWIVDPREDLVYVYNFENAEKTEKYTFDDAIPSGVLEGLWIRIDV